MFDLQHRFDAPPLIQGNVRLGLVNMAFHVVNQQLITRILFYKNRDSKKHEPQIA